MASTKKNKNTTARCADTHKPLKIVVGEKTYKIHGGSCYNPNVKERDVTVGFDSGFTPDEKGFPWNEGHSFLYPIVDMSVPKNADTFYQLLDFLEDQLKQDKVVFIGCIGGHGRTGLVLAALVTQMTGEQDSIKYVRENYCEKAVESDEQIKWLGEHFGILPQEATKKYSIGFNGGVYSGELNKYSNYGLWNGNYETKTPKDSANVPRSYNYVWSEDLAMHDKKVRIG